MQVSHQNQVSRVNCSIEPVLLRQGILFKFPVETKHHCHSTLLYVPSRDFIQTSRQNQTLRLKCGIKFQNFPTEAISFGVPSRQNQALRLRYGIIPRRGTIFDVPAKKKTLRLKYRITLGSALLILYEQETKKYCIYYRTP